MSSRRGFLHPHTRLLAVLVLLSAFFVIVPPQTALADTTFTITTPPSGGTYPYNVAVADFNRDGIPDLAIADQVSASIAIKLGNGDGTFHDGPLLSFPFVNFVYSTDVNRDGRVDIIDVVSQVTGGGVTTLYVRLGNGDGTFGSTILTTTAPFFTTNAAFGDVNGDGIIDTILVDPFNNQVRVLKGNGDGTFTVSTILASGGANPFDIATVDWDGDGKRDLVVVNSVGKNVSVFFNTGNDGSGNSQFTPAVGSPYSLAAGMMPVALTVIARAGAGGGPGIAVVAEPTTNPTTTPGTLTTLLYNGTNGFTVGSPVNIGILPSGVKAGGFTGSGNTDVAVSFFPSTPGGIGSVAVYAGNGIGGFATTAVATIPTGHGSKPLVVGDFNRDGKPDVVVPNADDNTLTVGTNTTTPFVHPAPYIDLIPVAPVAGTTVTVFGSGFVTGLKIFLSYQEQGGTQYATVVSVSADGKQFQFTLPANKKGRVLFLVTNPDGEIATTDLGINNFINVLDKPIDLPHVAPANPPIPNVQPGPLPLADPPVACNVSPCNPTNLPVGRPASA